MRSALPRRRWRRSKRMRLSVSSAGAPRCDERTLMRLIAGGTLYVTSDRAGYCPSFVLDKYDLVRAGVLWRVVPQEAD